MGRAGQAPHVHPDGELALSWKRCGQRLAESSKWSPQLPAKPSKRSPQLPPTLGTLSLGD